jgi:hypothetical protein
MLDSNDWALLGIIVCVMISALNVTPYISFVMGRLIGTKVVTNPSDSRAQFPLFIIALVGIFVSLILDDKSRAADIFLFFQIACFEVAVLLNSLFCDERLNGPLYTYHLYSSYLKEKSVWPFIKANRLVSLYFWIGLPLLIPITLFTIFHLVRL